MDEKEWLCFEKSGRVADYLAYCQSMAGKFSDYESKDASEQKLSGKFFGFQSVNDKDRS